MASPQHWPSSPQAPPMPQKLSGCGRAARAQQQGVLGRVLLECPALVRLDVSGCRWLTSDALAEPGTPVDAALGMLPLRCANFAGCELLGGIGWLVCRWIHLESLDVSRTATDDGDLQSFASCSRLRSLDASGCCRIKGHELSALADASAVLLGRLCELRLADLAWVVPGHLGPVLHAAARCAKGPLRLDLSGCGGLSDASLVHMVPLRGQAWPGLLELRLGCSSRLTAAMVQCLGEATARFSADSELCRTASGASGTGAGATAGDGNTRPLLHGLETLDLSHLQCLGSKTSSVAASAAAAAISAVLQAAGPSLRQLSLDGCYAGGGVLRLLPQACPSLERVSLVGCTGVADADLAALGALRSLRDLAVGGGATLTWHEHKALTGLRGLTRLRIARRPFLTDTQLAPVLAANRHSLVQLELAGCASLTDAALLHLLPAVAAAAAGTEPAAVPTPAHVQHRVEQQQERQQEEQQQGEDAAERGPDGQQRQQVSDSQQQHSATEAAKEGQEGDQQTGEGRTQPIPSHAGRQEKPVPAHQRSRVPPPLTHLQLVCCDRISGASLRQLGRLRSLRLGGCPAVTEAAVQAAALCLTRLTLLELPSHVPLGSLPVAPAGVAMHLAGLQVVGGTEERAGSSTRRSRGGVGS